MKFDRKSIIGGTVAMAAALAASGAVASSFGDGGFDNCASCTSPYGALGSGSTAFANWTTFGNGGDGIPVADYVTNYWDAENGGNSVALGGGNVRGGVQQTFDTVIGRTYNVSYWIAETPPAPGKKGSGKMVEVQATGNAAGFATIGTSTGLQTMDWTQETYSFVATNSSTTLSFFNDTGGSINDRSNGSIPQPYNLALDNVSVTSVPEPAAWAMMIVGFGLIGGGLRRRTAALATA